MDPYAALGVQPNATSAQIRSAYLAGVAAVGPDAEGGGHEAAYRRLCDAYEMITSGAGAGAAVGDVAPVEGAHVTPSATRARSMELARSGGGMVAKMLIARRLTWGLGALWSLAVGAVVVAALSIFIFLVFIGTVFGS